MNPIMADKDLDLIFRALADPTRRAILKTLSRRESAVTELAEPFDMSLVAVSKHLKVLERAGLIDRRRDGTSFYLKLNPEGIRTADEWLNYYRRFWNESLDRLEIYLKQAQKDEKGKKP